MAYIDLNSDLGESFGAWQMGDDTEMLSIVTSANVACGFHAGDPVGVLKTLKNAKAQGVAVGAHIGYRDLVGFGRRNMTPTYDELYGDVIYQIGALQGLAKTINMQISYVKPHGALYNTISFDLNQAKPVIDAVKAIDPKLILMTLAGSPIYAYAQEQGLKVVAEAFADRAYEADGSLVSRSKAGAVLHDVDFVAKRILHFAKTGIMTTIDGKEIALNAQTICLHGDTKESVEMAKAIKTKLADAGIILQSFVENL